MQSPLTQNKTSLAIPNLTFYNGHTDSELSEWKPSTLAMSALFSPGELNQLKHSRPRSLEGPMLFYLSWENSFGKEGGIAAVASKIPNALKNIVDQVAIISPLHRNLLDGDKAQELQDLTYQTLEFDVPFGSGYVRVKAHEVHIGKPVYQHTEYLLETPTTKDFFQADSGPYHYSHESEEQRNGNDSRLMFDALFASKAVPYFIQALNCSEAIAHSNDWQFIASTLTIDEAIVDGVVERATTIHTIHNPFDHCLTEERLSLITQRHHSHQWPQIGGMDRPTFFTRFAPLVKAPLSTVSEGFAKEFFSDPLQNIFTSDQQGALRSVGVTGVNNGIFINPGEPPFTENAISEYIQGNIQTILAEKLLKRKQALHVIKEYQENHESSIGALQARGQISNPDLTELDSDIPLIFMFGRMDPNQKGFDLAARALEMLPHDSIRLVFSPIVTSESQAYKDDFTQLATEQRPGELVVFPFRFSSFEDYMALMSGADFVLMPSFYEPFGAANEALLAGTPVIARPTGGLVTQVKDIRTNVETGNGLLVQKEIDSYLSVETDHEQTQQWRTILSAAGPKERWRIGAYRDLVSELAKTIKKAQELYANDKQSYAQMLVNSYAPIRKNFDWETKTAPKYAALYQKAINSHI